MSNKASTSKYVEGQIIEVLDGYGKPVQAKIVELKANQVWVSGVQDSRWRACYLDLGNSLVLDKRPG